MSIEGWEAGLSLSDQYTPRNYIRVAWSESLQ